MDSNAILEVTLWVSAAVTLFIVMGLLKYVLRDGIIDYIDRSGEGRRVVPAVTVMYVSLAVFASVGSLRTSDEATTNIAIAILIGLLILISTYLGTRAVGMHRENSARARVARAERERAAEEAKKPKRRLLGRR